MPYSFNFYFHTISIITIEWVISKPTPGKVTYTKPNVPIMTHHLMRVYQPNGRDMMRGFDKRRAKHSEPVKNPYRSNNLGWSDGRRLRVSLNIWMWLLNRTDCLVIQTYQKTIHSASDQVARPQVPLRNRDAHFVSPEETRPTGLGQATNKQMHIYCSQS